MRNILAVLVLMVLAMCSHTSAFDQGLETAVDALEDTEVDESSADTVLDELALDKNILSVFRDDKNDDEKIMDTFNSIEESFVDTLNHGDAELDAHDRELEKLKDAVEADDQNEQQFTSLIETSRNSYSPALVRRLNEALDAHNIKMSTSELAGGNKKKIHPKIQFGLKKKDASRAALKKVAIELALAPNTKKRVIVEGERLLEEFKDYQAQFHKKQSLLDCDEKEKPKKKKPTKKPKKPTKKPKKPTKKPHHHRRRHHHHHHHHHHHRSRGPKVITKTIYKNKLVKLKCKRGTCMKHLPTVASKRPTFFPPPFAPQRPVAPPQPSIDMSTVAQQQVKANEVANPGQEQQMLEQQTENQVHQDEQAATKNINGAQNEANQENYKAEVGIKQMMSDSKSKVGYTGPSYEQMNKV